MEVLGHDDVASHNEFIFASDFFEDAKKNVFASCGFKKLPAVITAAGDEVKFTTTMKSLQPFGHGDNIVPTSTTFTLRFAKPAPKDGAPT